MAKRNDNRSIRTRRLIINTMFELLGKHTFENINVSDICSLASISRATFYTHFEDKYQLVVKCMEEFVAEISRRSSGGTYKDLIEITVKAIEMKKEAFHKLFTGRENRELKSKLLDFLTDHMTTVLENQQKQGADFPVPISVIAVFYAYGMAGIITHWVIGRLNTDTEELIVILLELNRLSPFSNL